MSIVKKICIVETLVGKNPVGKNNPGERKRVHHSYLSYAFEITARKTQWDKTLAKGKRVQCVDNSSSCNHDQCHSDINNKSLRAASQSCVLVSQMLKWGVLW